MKAIARLAQPLRNALVAFFRHEIALHRVDDGVRLVLQERPPGERARVPTRAELIAAREARDLVLMREQLAALLDELPETRNALRHLVFVERALHRKGLRALHRLPLDVLQRALEQLEGLVTNWSPVGLASLRSKMAVAIIDREHMNPEAEADAYQTAAVLDSVPLDLPEVDDSHAEDDALAAAYSALGDLAPAAIEVQGELSSPSARELARERLRPLTRQAGQPDIEIRALID